MRRRSMLEVCAIGLAAAVCSPRLAMAVQKTEIRMARPFNLKEKAVKFNNGRTMPVLGLGTYSLHGQTCIRAVRAALDCGVRLIDTASMYGNEREVGMAVHDAVKNGLSREEIFVTTKIYPTQFGNPQKAIEESMSRLDLGYIDLLLLHHPGNGDVAAYRTLEKAVEEGAVRSIGLSNWYIKELSILSIRIETLCRSFKKTASLCRRGFRSEAAAGRNPCSAILKLPKSPRRTARRPLRLCCVGICSGMSPRFPDQATRLTLKRIRRFLTLSCRIRT